MEEDDEEGENFSHDGSSPPEGWPDPAANGEKGVAKGFRLPEGSARHGVEGGGGETEGPGAGGGGEGGGALMVCGKALSGNLLLPDTCLYSS